MSFMCKSCNAPSQNGKKPLKRVLEARAVEYMREGVSLGHGVEIVKEIFVCSDCNDPNYVADVSGYIVREVPRQKKKQVRQSADYRDDDNSEEEVEV